MSRAAPRTTAPKNAEVQIGMNPENDRSEIADRVMWPMSYTFGNTQYSSRQMVRDHSDESSFIMVFVCARIALMIINATVIMVASAALSNTTPTSTTTASKTAKMNIVVKIAIRNRPSQMPVLK